MRTRSSSRKRCSDEGLGSGRTARLTCLSLRNQTVTSRQPFHQRSADLYCALLRILLRACRVIELFGFTDLPAYTPLFLFRKYS